MFSAVVSDGVVTVRGYGHRAAAHKESLLPGQAAEQTDRQTGMLQLFCSAWGCQLPLPSHISTLFTNTLASVILYG